MRVVHCKKEKYTEYIGRPSKLGNPYVIGEHGTREEVIAKDEIHIRNSPELLAYIKALPENSVLGCWCAPKYCHGDVIVKIWKELNEKGD